MINEYTVGAIGSALLENDLPSHNAGWLLDYLESRRVALSIPDSTELAFFGCTPDTVKTTPCVVFYCESGEIGHSEKITLNLRVDYINELGVVDSTEESAIASAKEAAQKNRGQAHDLIIKLFRNDYLGES